MEEVRGCGTSRAKCPDHRCYMGESVVDKPIVEGRKR